MTFVFPLKGIVPKVRPNVIKSRLHATDSSERYRSVQFKTLVDYLTWFCAAVNTRERTGQDYIVFCYDLCQCMSPRVTEENTEHFTQDSLFSNLVTLGKFSDMVLHNVIMYDKGMGPH